MKLLDRNQWDAFISDYPDAHILQTGSWGDFKANFGWQVVRMQSGDCGAQLLVRNIPLGFSIGYIPKGPLGSGWEDLISDASAYCRLNRIHMLKLETDAWDDDPISNFPDVNARMVPAGSIQPQRTIVIDLSGGEDAVLARMKQKTRYNIRLAEKKGVQVQPADDLDTFYALMETTARRDRFGVHSREYYQDVYRLFPRDQLQLFIAKINGEPLGGIMVFRHGRRAWYFYGASANDSRNLMPTYLLQWFGIRWAIAAGCLVYDLWGVPDYPEEILERDFLTRSQGLWGVYRFKRGFGGQVKRAAPAWDLVLSLWRYRIFRFARRISGTSA